MLLAGDIGGTKTSLALYLSTSSPFVPIRQETFQSDDFTSFEKVIEAFLDGNKATIDKAVVGVAGPVLQSKAEVTNLAWTIDAEHIEQNTSINKLVLINDLEAIASSIPYLRNEDIFQLTHNTPTLAGSIAVLAPGTGLGEAFLVWDGYRYRAYPSEGGHADFAPINSLEAALLDYLHQYYEHVSYERVCSGIGIPNIFAFLRDTQVYDIPDWFNQQIAIAEDSTPIIVDNALDEEDALPICKKTLEMFIQILGSEASNLALKVLATGGVYIAGGIPPRIIPQLQLPAFLERFVAKGRFSDLMQSLPVSVIINNDAALLGAACKTLYD